jgi:hypothetical protein
MFSVLITTPERKSICDGRTKVNERSVGVPPYASKTVNLISDCVDLTATD